MKLTVVWTDRALGDLDNIVAYIGARDRAAALRLQDRIEEAVLPVTQFPYLYGGG